MSDLEGDMDFANRNNRSVIAWGVIDLMAIVGMLCVQFIGNSTALLVKICVWVSFALFFLQLISIFFHSNKRITGAFLFLALFYLFQNGQLLLWASDVSFNNYYVMYFEATLFSGAIFTSVSNLVAAYAGILCCRRISMKKWRVSKIDRYDRETVSFALGIAVILLGLVVIPLTIWKFTLAIRGGYDAVREAENSIPSVVGFIEYMFSPFGLAYLLYTPRKRNRVVAMSALILFYLLTTLCGDRTTGISGLLALSFALYIRENDDNKRRKLAVGLAMTCVALACLGYIVAYVRTGDAEYSIAIGDVITGVVQEIGFSCIPLLCMMSIVPGSEAFLYGKGYLYSLIGGIVPSKLDVTGTVEKINQQSHIFEEWQTQYYPNFDFGLGFSLNAESYINFGWFGFIAIFVVCFVVVYFLNQYQEYLPDSIFPKYVACILIFAWVTLARRDSYYVWKAIVYCVVLLQIYLWICVKIKNLLCKRQK